MSADEPTLAELRDQHRNPIEGASRPSWSVLIYAALREQGPLSTYGIAKAVGLINRGQVLQRLRQLEVRGRVERVDREDGIGGGWWLLPDQPDPES
jgi:DNA-binding HxlR family transcriptional regulator